MLSLLAPIAALAADPMPCVLDRLADGRVAWAPDGTVDLLSPAGKRIARVPTGVALGASTQVGCAGTTVKLTFVPDGNLMRLQTVKLDFADAIDAWARFDPVELGTQDAAAAAGRGDYAAAADALAPLDATDPRVTRAWTALGRSAWTASAGGSLAAIEAAQRSVPFGGWSPDDVDTLAWRHANALLAAGKGPEAVAELASYVEAHPDRADARLALADARFAQGDLAGAEADYRALLALVPLAELPARVGERCKACAKAMKKGR